MRASYSRGRRARKLPIGYGVGFPIFPSGRTVVGAVEAARVRMGEKAALETRPRAGASAIDRYGESIRITAILLAALATAGAAEAATRGVNGRIVFTSGPFVGSRADIYVMNADG